MPAALVENQAGKNQSLFECCTVASLTLCLEPVVMLEIHRSVDPETKGVVLTISGSADFHNVDPLVHACNAVVSGKYPDVTVDLGGLTFISSMGIGALVSLQRSVRTSGGVMRLTKVQPAIYQCLHHARLNEVFTIIGPC